MPVHLDQAIAPNRLQISNRALVLSCICFLATFFGASAITISFSLVVQAHADSPEYFSMAAVLLIVWFATLINMYRLTIAAIRVDG